MISKSSIILAFLLIAISTFVWLRNVALTQEEVDAMKKSVEYPVLKNTKESTQYTYTWLGSPRHSSAKEGTAIEKLLEEAGNIEIKPIFLDLNAYARKKPLMFSSGNIPDIINEIDPLYLQKDAHHGFLCPLPIEWITKYAPNYVHTVNKFSPAAWLCTNYKGINYGIPYLFGEGKTPRIGIWRKDWLENVGIHKTPKTLEEMYEAYKRLRNNDPDQNGKKDTYARSGSGSYWALFFCEIFGAYGVTPFDWMERDGQLFYGGLLPGTKEALKTLNKWYKEGLIDPEYVTDGQAGGQGIITKFLSSQIGYFINLPRYSSYSSIFKDDNPQRLEVLIKARNPKAELTGAYFPMGPSGLKGNRVWGREKGSFSFGKHLRNNPEKIIPILKLLDQTAVNFKLYYETTSGIEDYHWKRNKPSKNPYQNGITYFPKFENSQTKSRELIGNYFGFSRYDPRFNKQMRTEEEDVFMEIFQNDNDGLSSPIGKPDIVPSSSHYMENLRNYQLTFFNEIIIGDRPVSDFDEFKTNWLKRGGDILQKEANQMGSLKKQLLAKAQLN